jgi:hypothetical protein
MSLSKQLFWIFTTVIALVAISPQAGGEELVVPDGFRAIFNGKDLTGWYGLNPHSVGKLEGAKKDENLASQRAEFSKYWTIDSGELVNDGRGPYATTEEEFGDIELLIEYKTVAGADSGIYLRGTPQVQIWDWNQVFDPTKPTRKPHLGSGGLFNNTAGSRGRDPAVLADRPFGQWNEFRIRQIGDRTWVWLNDKVVVENAVMENFWDRGNSLPERGPIMLQTHGGEIRWRNLFVRDIGKEEAEQILTSAKNQQRSTLAESLTLHASFDQQMDADFATGDKACYVGVGKDLVSATQTEDVVFASGEGRFGGALHFRKKNPVRPLYKDGGTIGYNDSSWTRTVSVWLKLDPDKDLEPGYCDPVQIVGNSTDQGFIFLEWSKDETPRLFRYAIRPLKSIWNPTNVGWDEIPSDKRPMVQVAGAPFSRQAWTHAVFTIENVNDKTKPSSGRLYLNGKLQGTIENWDLTFGWQPDAAQLVLGAAYVGYLDDLAVFDRALTDAEVEFLYKLDGGVGSLR